MDRRNEYTEHETPTGDLLGLIRQAQGGSQEAYVTLLAKYRPLLDASVGRFAVSELSHQDLEDMREEAERVFLNALITFDTEQDGVEFGLYAKICLHNGLISEWRKLNARRRHSALSLEEDEAAEREDPANRLIEEERFRQLYRRVREHLSEMENHVWWLYVAGVEVQDIAHRLGKDEKSIHNAIYRIRQKLRRLLSENGEMN